MKTSALRYLEITNRILEALKSGVAPWQRPWRQLRPTSAISGRPYRGINRVLLEYRAIEMGWDSHQWTTYAAAKRAGGHVRRGEKATMILVYERRPKKEPTAPSWDLEVSDQWLFFASHAWVFNARQTENLDAMWENTSGEPALPCDAEDDAESIIARSGAEIVHGGNAAAYVPSLDCIKLPFRTQFRSSLAYFATAFHELGHWTGHPSRLNRNHEGRLGEPSYAYEELVAELTAAFLTGEAGLEVETQHTAAYLASWIRLLESDCRAIVSAARQAQAAVDCVLGDREPQVVPATALGVEEGASRPDLIALD